MPDDEDYPYMQGDLVCDAELPGTVAWSCIDASMCSSVTPSLDNMVNAE